MIAVALVSRARNLILKTKKGRAVNAAFFI
jgi:hypothetical protein